MAIQLSNLNRFSHKLHYSSNPLKNLIDKIKVVINAVIEWLKNLFTCSKKTNSSFSQPPAPLIVHTNKAHSAATQQSPNEITVTTSLKGSPNRLC
jgi:hypothetical protein